MLAALGSGLELPAAAVPSASLKFDQPLLHMVVPAVAADAAPVILGMSPDRVLKRYTLPKEVAGWSAVKGKHLSPQSSAPGPQKVHINCSTSASLHKPCYVTCHADLGIYTEVQTCMCGLTELSPPPMKVHANEHTFFITENEHTSASLHTA